MEFFVRKKILLVGKQSTFSNLSESFYFAFSYTKNLWVSVSRITRKNVEKVPRRSLIALESLQRKLNTQKAAMLIFITEVIVSVCRWWKEFHWKVFAIQEWNYSIFKTEMQNETYFGADKLYDWREFLMSEIYKNLNIEMY